MVTRVFDYLEKTAELFPSKVAFIDDIRRITFSELKEEALSIATAIAEKNISKKPIVIFLEKSISCISSFLGVSYSSNYYSPIDIKMPKERIDKILNTLKPELIITNRSHYQQVKEFISDEKILLYEDIIDNKKNNDLLVMRISRNVIDTDILYVLFTSGSTGQPKGVIINHRAVIDFIDWISECYDFTENTIFGNQAQLYFDLSIQDVFAPIKNGSTTVLISNRLYVSPLRVWKRLIECNVNTLVWIPSMLSMFANLDILRNAEKAPLKAVLFCGEVMPMKQLNYWIENYPDVTFANLYGPTECTEACTYYTLDRHFEDDEVLPMGIACENSEAIVVDDNGKEISEPDEIGELLMRGTCLSSGYYNNPEKTAEAFVQNPLHNNYPETVYRTGDLVFYNEKNELVYVSRKDFQVKVRGYRVELGEIEAACSSVPEISYNCCLFNEKSGELIMVYTGNIDDDNLKDLLSEKLQDYMIPSVYHKLDNMIFNLNGKIDRVELKNRYCND